MDIEIFHRLKKRTTWIFYFLKKMKKWKHTVNYNLFEYIFRKSNAFSVDFEGKIRFSKKVKKVKSAC